MVESYRIKKVKKYDFVTEGGKHIHLTEEQIYQQKKIEEDAKAKVAKRESKARKEELVDLLGPEMVNKYYNDKLYYDRYYDKMLNRRAESRIINCDELTKKGLITLKVYIEDGKSEVFPTSKPIQKKMDYIHEIEAEMGINLDIPLSEQDPLKKLNDLANKKRKLVDDIHDYFKANKRLKSSVQYEDHPAGTVLNEPVLEIFFRNHQGPGLDDHARTFNSLLLTESDKRNLNLLKQMRTIKQLSGSETEEGLCKELQFIFVDNSKLNVIYLLNRSLKRFVSLLEDDFDLQLTPVLRPYSSTRVETSTTTQNPVRIIPGPAGIVQTAKLLKETDILPGCKGVVMSTQEYMKKVVEDVGEDEDFMSGSWVSATDYVNVDGDIVSGCLGYIKNFLYNGKLDRVVAIVKSCSPNVIGDLTVTMKDISGTIPGTIHHKVINEGGYRNDITVGAAFILANVLVSSPKPSMHYLSIPMRNVFKVFRKDMVSRSGSG
ncbi:zinc finger, CCHC-type containing protein [Tanacetum coccineum]